MNLKLLWYCTKNKPYLIHMPKDQEEFENGIEFSLSSGEEFKQACIDIKALSLYLNGKIVAVSDYDCEEIIHTYENGASVHHDYSTKTLDNEQLLRKSRIFGQAIDDYLGDRQYDKNNNVVGYAIHIKNLNIFDKPKALREFEKVGSYNNPTIKCKAKEQGRCNYGKNPFTGKIVGCLKARLTKAPQNMCYAFDKYGNKYVLISVHPEWLAMILNGLKDVELRRKVLKEML